MIPALTKCTTWGSALSPDNSKCFEIRMDEGVSTVSHQLHPEERKHQDGNLRSTTPNSVLLTWIHISSFSTISWLNNLLGSLYNLSLFAFTSTWKSIKLCLHFLIIVFFFFFPAKYLSVLLAVTKDNIILHFRDSEENGPCVCFNSQYEWYLFHIPQRSTAVQTIYSLNLCFQKNKT